MQRIAHTPRPDWKQRVEEIGFTFHTIVTDEDPTGVYWDESAYWAFSEAEIDTLDDAATELHQMCLAAAEHVVSQRLYGLLGIPPHVAKQVEASWRAREGLDQFSLYGRFDLAWSGAGSGPPKLLEYNADTPTALFESAVVQWHWLEECFPEADQFNSIHEKLVERWALFARSRRDMLSDRGRLAHDEPARHLHLTCTLPNDEDEGTLNYIAQTAMEAGLAVKTIAIQDIGWTVGPRGGHFSDLQGDEIRALFKLYPWEWLVKEEFGGHLLDTLAAGRIVAIEPAWKMLLSNKGILPILWELYPHHPYLLEAHFRADRFRPGSRVVAKPLLSREGANISIAELGPDGLPAGAPLIETGGMYGAEGYVYQAFNPVRAEALPDGRTIHAAIGAFMVGDACAGIGIREDSTTITRNTSRFVPHLFR